MRGLAQPVVLGRGPFDGGTATQTKAWSCPGPSTPIYGLVISRGYPGLDECASLIADQEPGGLWVCAETDLEAKRLLDGQNIDPVLVPLNLYWRGETYDLRRLWRDSELLLLCDRVYVFQRTKSQWTTWLERGIYPGLSVVTTPEKARGRNPRRPTYQAA